MPPFPGITLGTIGFLATLVLFVLIALGLGLGQLLQRLSKRYPAEPRSLTEDNWEGWDY